MVVVWLFLTVPRVCLQFVIVAFPDHTHLLILKPESVLLKHWSLVVVVWLFLTVPRVCLQFVIVAIPDNTHLLILKPESVLLKHWSLVVVVWLFLTVPRVCLQFVIVAFPGNTHLLILKSESVLLNHWSLASCFVYKMIANPNIVPLALLKCLYPSCICDSLYLTWLSMKKKRIICEHRFH